MKSGISKILLAACLFLVVSGGGCGSGSAPAGGPSGVRMGGAIQGVPLSLTGATMTVAGSGTAGSADGVGAAAGFRRPYCIATDGSSLYVADTENHMIRRIDIATGAVDTLAGSAGNGGYADGFGAAARFHTPIGITTDGTNLFVTDGACLVRKIVIATAEVSTLAGSPGSAGAVDGIGSEARFSEPYGITTDGTALFVVDQGSNTIRRVSIATGAVSTLAGTAGSPNGWLSGTPPPDGTGLSARFVLPYGITTDGTDLYVTEPWTAVIRKVAIATGEVTTIAGSYGTPGTVDGAGDDARFQFPVGVTTDGTHLYIADPGAQTIRRLAIATAEATTLAGSAGVSGFLDGTGEAARFQDPLGITTDGKSLFVGEFSNHAIRRID